MPVLSCTSVQDVEFGARTSVKQEDGDLRQIALPVDERRRQKAAVERKVYNPERAISPTVSQEVDYRIGKQVGREIAIHWFVKGIPPRRLGIKHDVVLYGVSQSTRRVEHAQAGCRVVFDEFAQEGRLPHPALPDDVMRHNGSLLVSGTTCGDKPRASKQASVKEQPVGSVSVFDSPQMMER